MIWYDVISKFIIHIVYFAFFQGSFCQHHPHASWWSRTWWPVRSSTWLQRYVLFLNRYWLAISSVVREASLWSWKPLWMQLHRWCLKSLTSQRVCQHLWLKFAAFLIDCLNWDCSSSLCLLALYSMQFGTSQYSTLIWGGACVYGRVDSIQAETSYGAWAVRGLLLICRRMQSVLRWSWMCATWSSMRVLSHYPSGIQLQIHVQTGFKTQDSRFNSIENWNDTWHDMTASSRTKTCISLCLPGGLTSVASITFETAYSIFSLSLWLMTYE